MVGHLCSSVEAPTEAEAIQEAHDVGDWGDPKWGGDEQDTWAEQIEETETNDPNGLPLNFTDRVPRGAGVMISRAIADNGLPLKIQTEWTENDYWERVHPDSDDMRCVPVKGWLVRINGRKFPRGHTDGDGESRLDLQIHPGGW